MLKTRAEMEAILEEYNNWKLCVGKQVTNLPLFYFRNGIKSLVAKKNHLVRKMLKTNTNGSHS